MLGARRHPPCGQQPDGPGPGSLGQPDARRRVMSSRPTAIEALAGSPSTSALVLDFDGVLSPIVDDPTTRAVPRRVVASLRRLAGSLGLLAVVSGRPVEFLENRVPVPGMPLL